jgi:hypothetical protein
MTRTPDIDEWLEAAKAAVAAGTGCSDGDCCESARRLSAAIERLKAVIAKTEANYPPPVACMHGLTNEPCWLCEANMLSPYQPYTTYTFAICAAQGCGCVATHGMPAMWCQAHSVMEGLRGQL